VRGEGEKDVYWDVRRAAMCREGGRRRARQLSGGGGGVDGGKELIDEDLMD
jgi:hypothetical protein